MSECTCNNGPEYGHCPAFQFGEHGTPAGQYIGQHVRMTWTGGTRDGRISGEFRADTLPTGATFVPVTWEDGTTDNVDSRVLSSLGLAGCGHSECDEHSRCIWS